MEQTINVPSLSTDLQITTTVNYRSLLPQSKKKSTYDERANETETHIHYTHMAHNRVRGVRHL